MSVELADLDKVIDFLSDLKRREFRWKSFPVSRESGCK